MMRAGSPTCATKFWAYSDSNSDHGISSASCTQRLVAANFPSKGSLKSWAELGVGSTFRYTGANDNARVLNYLTRFSCTLTTHLLLAHPIPVTFSPFFSKSYVGYFVFYETVWSGQTPGKRYVKIRVIRDDGRRVRLQQSTLRALLRPFDDLFFIGVFFIVFNQREKRLGDLVAGTLVIQEEQPLTTAALKVSKSAQSLANKLLIQADISSLLPEDFAVIREYLQRREGMIPNARNELSKQLATQVKEIIGWEKMPTKVDANVFLEAVYQAYQQQVDN